jgi:hypothetical protein
MKKLDNILLLLVVIVVLTILAGIILESLSKTTLIVDGQNNVAYAKAINEIYKKGLRNVSEETARLANAYVADCNPKQLVLLDPTVQNVKDFYELANYHKAKLVIGSTSNEVELKVQLFESGFSGKKIHFQIDQDWDPDSPKNLKRNYTY